MTNNETGHSDTPAAEEVTVHVTRLEMVSPSSVAVPVPAGIRLAIMLAENMPLHLYRYLYEVIGKPHHWMLRRTQSDEVVSTIIKAEKTRILLLYVDGCPAGFAEMRLNLPESVDLHYFGLVPDYQGRGLAKFFFSEVLAAAWSHNPQKLRLETNSLDSPRALQLYQRMGFAPVSTTEEVITLWK
ncbi:GNAT family N-acetyltransferase [Pseudochrobactrum asaccharolyticum]|uniref:GNAT family N-acetyltransferase n=1 Tax=Pseudochrobactrum asaccharolyticum TaxID=354351 RepID=UPI00404128EA